MMFLRGDIWRAVATNRLHYHQQACSVNNLIDAPAVYLVLGGQKRTFNG